MLIRKYALLELSTSDFSKMLQSGTSEIEVLIASLIAFESLCLFSALFHMFRSKHAIIVSITVPSARPCVNSFSQSFTLSLVYNLLLIILSI